MEEGAREYTGTSFIYALVPFMTAPQSYSSPLPVAPPPGVNTLRVGTSACSPGRHTRFAHFEHDRIAPSALCPVSTGVVLDGREGEVSLQCGQAGMMYFTVGERRVQA